MWHTAECPPPCCRLDNIYLKNTNIQQVVLSIETVYFHTLLMYMYISHLQQEDVCLGSLLFSSGQDEDKTVSGEQERAMRRYVTVGCANTVTRRITLEERVPTVRLGAQTKQWLTTTAARETAEGENHQIS